jgi:hypothetical protein
LGVVGERTTSVPTALDASIVSAVNERFDHLSRRVENVRQAATISPTGSCSAAALAASSSSSSSGSR